LSYSELNIIFLTCKCQCKINFDEISPINQSNLKHQNLLKSIRVKRQRRHRGHRLLSSTSSFHQEADVIGQVALFLVLSRGTLLHSSIIIIRGIDSAVDKKSRLEPERVVVGQIVSLTDDTNRWRRGDEGSSVTHGQEEDSQHHLIPTVWKNEWMLKYWVRFNKDEILS